MVGVEENESWQQTLLKPATVGDNALTLPDFRSLLHNNSSSSRRSDSKKRERESRFQNRGAPYNVEMRLYRQRVLFSLYTATSSCCSSSSNPLFILQVQSSAPCVCGISQGSHSYSKTKEKLTVLKATMHTKHMNGKFCIVTSHCINQSWLKRWRARVPSSYAIITATFFS